MATERRSGKRADGKGARKNKPPVEGFRSSANGPYTDGSALTKDDVEFGKAMDRYKRDKRRTFPTWSEVLDVLRSLGYRKIAAEPE